MKDDLPDMGRLARGQRIGHGTPCRWHGTSRLHASPKMASNGKGAYLCAVCDLPDAISAPAPTESVGK